MNDQQDPTERAEVQFTPRWEGPIQGWATKYAAKNQWKVRPELDFDDLMQDAWLFFDICCKRYPHVVDPPHFMQLFKTCFRNHITDMATRRTRRPDTAAAGCSTADSDIMDLAIAVHGNLESIELELLIEDAPPEIQELLRAIRSGDKKPPMGRGSDGLRETTREYFNRMVGLVGIGVDVVSVIQNWIQGVPQSSPTPQPA